MLLLKNIAPESRGLLAMAMSMVMLVVLTVNATGSSGATPLVRNGDVVDAKDIKVLDRAEALESFEDKTSLSDRELKKLLSLVGFEGAALKTAWAVAKTESNGRPLAHNGDASTGDNSYGIFQINMIGNLGEARVEKFDLNYKTDLFNPVINAQIAYHMTRGGEDWSSWANSATNSNPRYITFKSKYDNLNKEN